jgi:hypothetical protein
MIQFTLMYMFQHDQVFTRTAVAKQAVEACDRIFHKEYFFDTTEENKTIREKFFWTKQQQWLLDKDIKRVIFTSNYGTGKTLVMKAKALQLGRKRQLFTFQKKQTDQGHLVDSREYFLEAKEIQLEKKELYYLKNLTNQNELMNPGKTFFILFTTPDALLFHSIHQEFEKLKEHFEVICTTSKLRW